MKKIANFTQTYRTIPEFTWGTDGENREFLIDYQLRDKVGIWWRKNIDLHTFSFHNYEQSAAKRASQKILKALPDTKIICYNNMTYGETLFRHLTFLKEQGITDVLWIQDDEFTTFSNISYIKLFLDFYKTREDINCVSLGASKQALHPQTADDIGEQIASGFYIYKTTCTDFHNFDKHAFSMGTSICNIDILLSFIENDQHHTSNYIYEQVFCSKGLALNLQRCVLNIPFFKPYNVVGMGGSLGCAQQDYEELVERFD